MENEKACAACASKQGLKYCGRCKSVSYCSVICQKVHWKSHKPACHFKVLPTPNSQTATPNDALSLLRTMTDPGITVQTPEHRFSAAAKAFNIPELRLAGFSELSAPDLLRIQRVCRSSYLTIAHSLKLEQRLFFAAGPGELVSPAREGAWKPLAIQPRNFNQQEAMFCERSPVENGDYLIKTQEGKLTEVSAWKVSDTDMDIVLNPFFTSLWPQDPTNMTLSPSITVPTDVPTASWRRMQLTSPPMKAISIPLWYTNAHGRGDLLIPSTGNVSSGVTLGNVADMLASQPKNLTYHWITPLGKAFWRRSTDAIVVPKKGDVEHVKSTPGVFVSPSNGNMFPGGFGMSL